MTVKTDVVTYETRVLQAGLGAMGFPVVVDSAFGPQTGTKTREYLVSRGVDTFYAEQKVTFNQFGASVRVTIARTDPEQFVRVKNALENLARAGANTGAVSAEVGTSGGNTNMVPGPSNDLSSPTSGFEMPTWGWAVIAAGVVVGGVVLYKRFR